MVTVVVLVAILATGCGASGSQSTPLPLPAHTMAKLSGPAAKKAAPQKAPAPRKFRNCSDLNKVYPHGVGRPGAKDKGPGKRHVTNFKVDAAVYKVNNARDRDRDGVACEKL